MFNTAFLSLDSLSLSLLAIEMEVSRKNSDEERKEGRKTRHAMQINQGKVWCGLGSRVSHPAAAASRAAAAQAPMELINWVWLASYN